MNEFFQNLKKESLNTKLSQNEKQYMRVALYDAMKKPRPVMQEVRYTRVQSSYVWYSFISSPRFALPVAVLLITGLGGGTAFASQGSLPGDVLYTVKVNITEPALGALAIGDEAKSKWNAQVAQTRLEEAEELAASGRLDANTSAQLAQDFDDHSNAAQELAQKVEDEDPGSGADLTAQFDSSLAAHDAILSRIGNDSSSSKQFTDDVVTHVRGHGSLAFAGRGDGSSERSLKTMSVQTFSAVAPSASTSSASEVSEVQTAPVLQTSNTPAQDKSLRKLKKSAASALLDAQKAFNSAKKSLDASTTLKVQDELAHIGAVVDAATSTASLTGALKDATVLKAFLKASKNLNRNFFNNDNRGRGNSNGDNKRDDDTSSSATVQATTSIQIQLKSNSGPDDSPHKSGGDDGGKNKGNDDSFIRNLLDD